MKKSNLAAVLICVFLAGTIIPSVMTGPSDNGLSESVKSSTFDGSLDDSTIIGNTGTIKDTDTDTTTDTDAGKSSAKGTQEYGDSGVAMAIGVSNGALPIVITGVVLVILGLACIVFAAYHIGKRNA